MKFNPSKYGYSIYTRRDGVKEIIAFSTYAKKVVKAKATCNPKDEYNEENGKQLAAARCNVRVARLRARRAAAKLKEANEQFEAAKKYLEDMSHYHHNSTLALTEALTELTALEEKM
jgi:hypothetical protein